MHRTPQLVLTTLTATLLLAACGDKAPADAPKGPVPVGVVTLQPAAVAIVNELPGRTTAFQVAEVRPQVSGILQRRLFTEGGEVKAGSALYQIDPAPYQAAYDSARGNLASAEASAQRARLKAERYQELVGIKAVSQQDNDDAVAARRQADAAVLVAKAAVDTARINLGYTRLAAPISGRIGKSSVTPGALLTANQAASLTTISQLDPIYVDVTQSSSELMRLRKALAADDVTRPAKIPVRLKLEDGSTYGQSGTLQFSDVTVDPGTSTVTLRALFPNPRHELLPGLYVRAVIDQGVDNRALLAPQRGITRNSQGDAVALVVDQGNVVAQRTLQLGRAVDDQWLVLSGLKAGDRLIVDGLQKIKPGATVKPVPVTMSGVASGVASAPAAPKQPALPKP